jgi:hypothetical protein
MPIALMANAGSIGDNLSVREGTPGALPEVELAIPRSSGPRRARLSLDPGSVLFAALLVYVLLYTAWSLGATWTEEQRGFVSDLAFLPVGLLVAALSWIAGRARGLDAATRRAWGFLALAFLFFWLGDALWFVSVARCAWRWSPRESSGPSRSRRSARRGCELGQGFHLARPMEADAFARLLRSGAVLLAPAAG